MKKEKNFAIRLTSIIIVLILLIIKFIQIDKLSHSVSDTLYGFVPYLLLGLIIILLIFNLSKKNKK